MSTKRLLSRWLPEDKLRGCNSATPSFYPSGTMWPHGEWSLGYTRETASPSDWHESPIDVSLGAEAAICDGSAGRVLVLGMSDAPDEDVAGDESAGQPLPLDLSDAPNSHNRAKRGLKGMSGYGQQMIKACGHLIQEKWPLHRKTLGTITLPPMSEQARREVVAAWPELTRQLLQWLSRRLERSGLPPIACSVTEVQPKRLQETGAGYLHWHLLWLNHPGRKGNWAVNPCDVRSWLNDVLARLVPSYQGGLVNVDTRPVKGVVAAYMAKYMSKGKQAVGEAVKDWGEGNCPRTWWNMTKSARDMVKAATFRGRAAGACLDEFLQRAFSQGVYDTYAFLSTVELEFDGRAVIVGWRGRFLPGLAHEVRLLLESVDIDRLRGEDGNNCQAAGANN